MLEKCQNFRSFDIFRDILDKRKGNVGQICVKGEGGLLVLPGQNWNNFIFKIVDLVAISFENLLW